jgi:hypothetical protein
MLQLPKPLGFGKASKLQQLTPFQQSKAVAVTAELAILAGLCDGINAGTPVLFRVKKAVKVYTCTEERIV